MCIFLRACVCMLVCVSLSLSLSFSLSLCVCGGDKAWCRASDFAYVQILCYKHIDVTLARVPTGNTLLFSISNRLAKCCAYP